MLLGESRWSVKLPWVHPYICRMILEISSGGVSTCNLKMAIANEDRTSKRCKQCHEHCSVFYFVLIIVVVLFKYSN